MPLIVRAPGIASADTTCNQPVSLIDVYPTLVDMCELTGATMKNDKGHPLDGHSIKTLLMDPMTAMWSGPDEALTTLYKWRMKYDPSRESYSLRSQDWRYIRYENGQEELYDTSADPHEWHNLAGRPDEAARTIIRELRAGLPKENVDYVPGSRGSGSLIEGIK